MEISQSAAALWAAGIGVGASAVASLIAARAAREQAEVGAKAQLEAVRLQAAEAHSQEKKRRQQRVYADFYMAANILRAACVDAEQTLKEVPSNAAPSELDEADANFTVHDDELHRKSRDLWHGYSAVCLEGPDAVADAAERLFGAFVDFVEAIKDWAKQVMTRDGFRSDDEDEATARIRELEQRMITLTKEFMEEAQGVLK
ncbi:hypothetical protein ACFV19_25180 [Streptomyces griseoluteus]|uniref:hypothetical protein n=1 Tax=Streptomyces griseoluteus TaxID=29306 RepID=UPI0036C27098